jgi:DNA segregation ATPase FtsK/SpoIIIE-like protein
LGGLARSYIQETAIMTSNPSFIRFLFSRAVPLLVLLFSGALAMAQADPPARVANLSRIEGSVVFAPAGETEWVNAELNRPITHGDRVWTDPGARAELHLGSSALHLDSQTFVDLTNVDSLAFQASLNEGTVNARVRDLQPGENFELDTPQLAFRASQPGDFRIDVDAKSGTTRVIVHSGAAQVFGAGGESLQMQAGEQLAFSGRDLEQVTLQVLPSDNGFDRWVADLNRREDQSITARYVPRDVVGYQQLDSYGTWAEDPNYGAVWYPTISVADWAPYRYGHWEFIAPWGWTWIENEPWGFAPFHYGRWAMVGSRWGWVPGRLGPRPVYSPALVGFVGGGGVNFSLSIGGGSGIGWFPLAPGEAWRPYYHASDRYVRNVNRNVVVNNFTRNNVYTYQHRSDAVTAVNVNDFSRGRPVHEHWSRVNPSEIARAPATAMPALPPPQRHFAEGRTRVQPQGGVPPITASRPQPQFVAPGIERRGPAFERGVPPLVQRGEAVDSRPQGRPRPDFRGVGPAATPPGQAAQPLFQPPGQQRREEARALQEQRREQQARPAPPQVQPAPQFQQERAARAQEEQQRRAQMQQERAQRDQQIQQQQRGQLDQQRRQQIEQERSQRDQQMQHQREAQERQQQSMQERMQRDQAMQQRQQAMQQQQQAMQERAQRQQAMQQQAQERAQRQQQAVQQQQAMQQQQAARQQAMQERAQQQAAMQQQRAAAMQQRQQAQQQAPAQRGEARGRGEERGRGEDRRQQAHDRRDESRS